MAQSLACVAVVTNYNLMDAALIARLHGAGLRALCYTVNDPAEARRLVAPGHRRHHHRRGGPVFTGTGRRERLTVAGHAGAVPRV